MNMMTRFEFRQAIAEVWGPVLNVLESIIADVQMHTVDYMKYYIEQSMLENNDAGSQTDIQFDVLARLSAKGCQLADAISVLLHEGHPDTAFSVWRTLQEIDVNSSIIASDKTGDIAMRFNDWGIGKVFRRERSLRELKSNELDDADYASLEQAYNERLNKYGDGYKKDMGWDTRNIFDRAKGAGKETDYRKYYSIASSYVHADILSQKLQIGISERNKHGYLVGPSGIGLDLPAMLTAHTLPQITLHFMTGTKFSTNKDEERIGQVLKKIILLFEEIDKIDPRNRAPHREGYKLIDDEALEGLPSL